MVNIFKCCNSYVIAAETTPPPSPEPAASSVDPSDASSEDLAVAPSDQQPASPSEQQCSVQCEQQSASPSERQCTASSEQQSASPSEQQSTSPIEQQSASPSEQQSTSPIEQQSASPSEQQSIAPSEQQSAAPGETPSAEPIVKPRRKKELALGRLSPDWPLETKVTRPQLTYEDPYADFNYTAAESGISVPAQLEFQFEDDDGDQEEDAYYDEDDDDDEEDEIYHYTNNSYDEDDFDDDLWDEEDLDAGNYYEPIDYDSLFIDALSADEFVEQQSAVERRPIDELLSEVRRSFQPERLHLQPSPRILPAIPQLTPVAWRGPPFLPAIRYFSCGELVRKMLPKPEELEEAARNAAERQSRLPDIDADADVPAANDNTRTSGTTINGNNNPGTALLNEVASDVRPAPKPHKNLQGKGLKRPPQPHMCIRERNAEGEELFINVMSWTRIMMPASPDDPIPLYGGMRVPRCNQRSPPNIYAVMVNPDILKHVGRTCPDPHEKIALVQLMSDFVEAMNPGLELSRSAEILVDRDLAGELKDIWCAVQAKRERDKETINMGGVPTYSQAIANAVHQQQRVLPLNQQPTVSSVPIATPAGPALVAAATAAAAVSNPSSSAVGLSATATIPTTVSSATTANSLNNNANSVAASAEGSADSNKCQAATSAAPVIKANTNVAASAATTVSTADEPDAKTSIAASAVTAVTAAVAASPILTTATTTTTTTATAAATAKSQKSPPVVASSPAPPTTPPTSTKKERLGGFLPNGCQYMFPFIKSKKDKKDKKNAAAASSEAATNAGGDEAPEKSDSGKDGDDLDRANM